MLDYLTSLLDQLSFYATIVKFLFYFLVGSILLLFLKKLIYLIRFLLNKFDKASFLENLRFFFNIIIFVIISILIGWIVVMIITNKIF